MTTKSKKNLNEPVQLVEWLTQEKSTNNINTPKINPHPNAEQNAGYILAQKFIEANELLNVNGSIFVYNITKGCFENLNQNLSRLLRLNLPSEYVSQCTLHRDKEVLAWLCSLLPLQYRLKEYPALINFRNGVYDVESGTLKAHSPNYQFLYCIDMDFTYTPQPTPVFDQFITDITADYDEFKITLYELMGYTISNTRIMKSLFFLYGPSNTGKSVFINLLLAILGPALSSSIPLSAIGKNFRTASLLGSRLNAFSETDYLSEKDIPLLKSLTGGDCISADIKFQTPIEFENKAVLLFSTNKVDGFEIVERGDAFWNRLFFLPFVQIIPAEKQNPFLMQALLQELPDIVCKYAVPGWTAVYRNGCRFTRQDFITDVKDSILNNIDSISHFVNTCCIIREGAIILSPTLFERYIAYCNTNGLSPLGRTHFFQRIYNLAPFVYRSKKDIDGIKENVILGIELNECFLETHGQCTKD